LKKNEKIGRTESRAKEKIISALKKKEAGLGMKCPRLQKKPGYQGGHPEVGHLRRMTRGRKKPKRVRPDLYTDKKRINDSR